MFCASERYDGNDNYGGIPIKSEEFGEVVRLSGVTGVPENIIL